MRGEIRVDASDLLEKLQHIEMVLGGAERDAALYQIMKKMAGSVRQVVKGTVPPKYHVSAGRAAGAVRSPQIGTTRTVISVKDIRGVIGQDYEARASISGLTGRKKLSTVQRKGWLSGKNSRRRYKVLAYIVKAGPSKLPDQGNRIHFYAAGRVMARLGGTRTLVKPVGIASSQMPPNRSEPETAKRIGRRLEQYTAHEFDWRLSHA